MARFLVDESLPYALAESLSNSGHEATHAYDAGLRGANDEDVYREAERRGVLMLTRDLDFADIRRFPGGVGVVVVRIRGQTRGMDLVHRVVSLLVEFRGEIEALGGQLLILEPGRIRIRRRSADFS